MIANMSLRPVEQAVSLGSDDYVCDVPPFPVNHFNIMAAAPKAIRAHLSRPLPIFVHDHLQQPLE